MKTHDLQQGSAAWHDFRSTHYGASEAAAMLGLSKYTTRSELLHLKHTGISKDVDAATQARFDKGHETEALARPIIEARIGEALSPVTCSDGNMSCSCDGITFGDDIAWEHKQYNDALFRNVLRGNLPEEQQPQCQQVLMITGAAKLIFTCSDGTEQNMVSMDVFPEQGWFNRLTAGWAAFQLDLESYTPTEVAEKPIPTAVMALPALQVQIKGEVTNSNMPAFIDAADAFLGRIKTELKDDQDFADADANIKACDTAEKGIDQAKAAITAQAADIDTIMRTMDLYKTKLRDVRLKLTKLVDSEKMARKLDIIEKARKEYDKHVSALEDETKPIILQPGVPDFAGATKNKRTITSIKEAVNQALVNGKIEADAVAKDVRAKLAWINEYWFNNGGDYKFLFADLQQIIGKPLDDFKLLVTTRIEAHKASEAAKIERIRAEEQVKAEAAAKAKVEAEAETERQRIVLAAQEEATVEARRKAAQIADQSKPFNSAVKPNDSKDHVERDFGFPTPATLPAVAKQAPDTVTIPLAEYHRLCDDSAMLNCLRQAGVDAWDGYDSAMELYEQLSEVAA